MSSNLRFLSERSLAVYEINMIEQWVETHRRNVRKQALTCFAWTSLFVFLAALSLILPASTQELISLLIP